MNYYQYTSQTKYKELQQCDHHKKLFESDLNLKYEITGKYDKKIVHLISGHIIGVALIKSTFWYSSDIHEKYTSDPWCYGPFCYQIEDTAKVSIPVQCKGKQRLWKIQNKDYNELIKDKQIIEKIKSWKKTYSHQLFYICHFFSLYITKCTLDYSMKMFIML